jgi:hypothetical protein
LPQTDGTVAPVIAELQPSPLEDAIETVPPTTAPPILDPAEKPGSIPGD